MAIKITKRGKTKRKVYKGTCYKCKTEVTATSDDVEYHHMEPSRDPREHSYYTVPCPVCGESIYVVD